MAGLAAAAAVPSGIVLKVLTANNYEDWSFRVKTYLLAKGLWKVVESAKEPPRVEGGDEAEFEAWNEKNAEALHAIHISCGEDIFPFIRGIDTAKAAWNTLEKKLKPAGARLPKREDCSSMAAPVVPSLIVNELLNKHNYEDWNVRVRTYLVAKGLWSVVEDATDPPLKGKYIPEDWEKTNAEALHAIHLCCGNDAFNVIRDEKRAHKAWYALSEFYGSGDTTHTESTKELGEKEDVDTENEVEKEVEKEATDKGDHQSDHDAQPEEVVQEKADELEEVDEGEGDGDENSGNDNTDADAVDYEDLFRAAKDSNWDSVMVLINKNPEAVQETAPTDEKKTILHYAVEDMRVDIVQQLMKHIKNEYVLERWDSGCNSALEYCCMLPDKDEMVEIAKCLVQKKTELSKSSFDDPFLLLEAFTQGRPKLADYLFNITEFKTDDPLAAQLISLSFSTKRFDIACKLIQQNPSLAIAKDSSENSPLNELACTPSAFLSGSRLKFWEKRIYHVISIKSSVKREEGHSPTKDNKGDVPTEAKVKGKPTPKPHAVSGDVRPEEDGKGKPTHAPHTIVDVPTYQIDKDKKSGVVRSDYFKCCCGIWNVPAIFQGSMIENFCKIFGISHIYEMKVNHFRVHEIFVCMCKVLTTEKKKELWEANKKNEFVESAMFQAAERGLVEFLTEILKVNPYLAQSKNEKDQNLFQVAVECRQAEVFNLIHGYNPDNIKACISMKDGDGNNMLHMMGISSPSSQTNRIRGAALQMQNELQWFKELERMASPEDLEAENTLGKTPREFFSENHTKLVKEGEKSMKDTATSCTVVGALIVTMMFAVAFTLPKPLEDNSNPQLLYRRAFRVFIIADAISLFTSTTSVVLFLGILTSRYAQDDFHRYLPLNMILGLLTLFLSVAAMVIVFASALFIILPSDTRIALLTTSLLAGIPIASFIWMQFPFLVEIIYLTYIRKLLGKKGQVMKLNIGKLRTLGSRMLFDT